VSSFLTLAILGMIPMLLMLLVILRDLVIVTGALVYNFRVRELEAAPSIISKVNTFTQILLVLVVVLDEGLIGLPDLAIQVLIGVVFITTIASGINYVWVWSRLAAHHGRKD